MNDVAPAGQRLHSRAVPPSSFGAWLRRQRKLRDLTQEELAQRAGCARVTIRKFEADEMRPSKQLAELLAQALEIPAEERAAFVQFARGAQTAAEPSAPRGTDARPTNNLPLQPTSFIGREREMVEVQRLLATTHLLTLTGSGGTGKTRLSLQIASEVLGNFNDGVWLIELAPLTDTTLVTTAIASVLGVLQEPGRPLLATLLDWLRDKQLLLILDNCEHLIEACAQFADAVVHSSRETRILATSREALGIAGETAYRVPSLQIPGPSEHYAINELSTLESMRLFIERARAAQPQFGLTETNVPAIAQICDRLDGIPLAIELAAARVKALRVEQIAARLDDRFRLLTGGSRTALPRQQTLRGTIDWSHSLLSEPERVLLRRLSVFVGGWTLEAAEAVCSNQNSVASNQTMRAGSENGLTTDYGGLATVEVLDLLTHLVDKSLVVLDEQAAEARYRMLETIRQYAREKLLDAGEGDVIRARHLAYFAHFADAGYQKALSADQIPWLQRYDAEVDNLRAAVVFSFQSGDPLVRLLLPASMLHYWNLRGFSEGIVALQVALAATAGNAIAPQLTEARVRALTALCTLLLNQGLYADAQQVANEAVSLAREIAVEAVLGPALTIAAHSALQSGDLATAPAQALQGLAANRSAGNHGYAAMALRALGDEAYSQSDYERAMSYYREGAAIQVAMGDTNYHAYEMRRMGYIALYRRELDQALAFMHDGLMLKRLVSERSGTLGALAGLAAIYAAQGQPVRAATLYGAIENLLDQFRTRLQFIDERDRERNLALTRAQLAPSDFDAAWEAGRRLTLEQAIAEAQRAPQFPAVPNLGSQPVTSRPPFGDLSVREREVAVLIAQGKSNRAIADQLVLSQRTVEGHVRNLLSKLGFNSRSQIAAWAVESGLVKRISSTPGTRD